MAETANIARIAELLSDELFSEFFWEKTGPLNENWPCEDEEKHKTKDGKKKKTHPSDVVFFYDEPYKQTRTYVQCDLKSYSASSISTSAITQAIESLAQQVACANKSDEWRGKYAHDHVSYDVCGLLFIYNHDGEYDKDFQGIMDTVKVQELDLPEGTKLVVLGPKEIFWLDNIRFDICMMRGQGNIGSKADCSYFYPQLDTMRNLRLQSARAATLEVLTAPWIILKSVNPKERDKQQYILFYQEKGESSQEFLYLLDLLRHFQVLKEDNRISIKMLQPDKNARSNFRKAVQQYNEETGEEGETNPLADLISNIGYSEISQVKSVFSQVDIGMRYE